MIRCFLWLRDELQILRSHIACPLSDAVDHPIWTILHVPYLMRWISVLGPCHLCPI